ncbi:MAG: MBL fold metallo-hydrolase, partial [Parasphingopyxis sp.]
MIRLFKFLGALLLWAVILIAALPVVIPPFLDRIYYDGPAGAHYDGERFFNPDEGEGDWEGDPTRPDSPRRGGFLMRFITGDDRPPWPAHVPVEPSIPEPRVEGDRMVVTWIGHATALVQTQGLNILTDPIWSDYATPYPPVGPKRVAAPGVRFEDLPPIDLVLVSHNHYDHLDLPTLRRLWERDRPLIVTSLGNETVIAQSGAKAVARDWGERIRVSDEVAVVVTRNHHWGSRWGVDRNRALWSSFVIETPAGNIFWAGDTGPGDMEWPRAALRHGPVRLAMIPIGAFRFERTQEWSGSHIGPLHAAMVWNRLGRPTAVGMHWGTFRLSWEGYMTPVRMLDMLLDCAGAEGFFRPLRHGQSIEVPPLGAVPELDEVRLRRCSRTDEVLA